MKFLAYLRSLASKFFHRPHVEDEIEEELSAHIQRRADDLERSGLDRAEAERRAHIEFGGQERFKEASYQALGGHFIETLAQDVRYSLRLLRKSPGFTIVAVLTLALAIGANAVVFGALNALILHPLNLPQEESLYAIQHGRNNTPAQSYPDYLDLRDRNRSFDDLAVYDIAQAGLDTGENATRVWLYNVSGNYFDVLGLQPYVGRLFHASDEHGPNSAPYLVLSYAYWHAHFHDDHGVVGHTVQLNKHPFTIVGVAPPDFHGTVVFLNPDFFAPIINQEQVEGWNGLNTRGDRWVHMAPGHLKAGVTPAQAIADLDAIGSYLEKTYPKDDSHMTFSLSRPGLYGDDLGRPIRAFLAGLLLLSGLILVAACANLGSLFAARAADRSREMALRLALGAGRARVLRQLFTEAILISLVGGAVGLWGSIALLRSLSAWQPFSRYPMSVPLTPGANVYVAALVLAVMSGILFGIVPVRQVLRTDPYEIVKAGSTVRIGRRIAARDLLLFVQIAICAVLVTSSMVAVRGLVRSLHSRLGFEPNNAMLADTDLKMAGYSGVQIPAMQRRMIDALATIPGVESVGLVDRAPASGDLRGELVFSETTTDLRPATAAATALTYSVSPEYFQAAGTALLSGSTFTWHDDQNAPPIAVINREFARKVFGSEAGAMDRYYKLQDGTRVHVVGIAEQGKYISTTEEPREVMFRPILQSPSSQTCLVVRSAGDPRQLAVAIRSKLRSLDQGLPVFTQPWTEEMELMLFAPRMATISLGVLGAMGAMLSITGIFGMAAYSVSKRMKELGIRMALGAQRKQVLQAALGRAFKLLAFGSIAGLVLGILASRVLAFIVYQATSRDPLVLAGVVLAMAFLGLLATWIPAQRALSVDPLMLLREE